MSECKCCHKALIISPTPVNGLPTTNLYHQQPYRRLYRPQNDKIAIRLEGQLRVAMETDREGMILLRIRSNSSCLLSPKSRRPPSLTPITPSTVQRVHWGGRANLSQPFPITGKRLMGPLPLLQQPRVPSSSVI